MSKLIKFAALIIILILLLFIIVYLSTQTSPKVQYNLPAPSNVDSITENHPMFIESLRNREYPFSQLNIEETLTDGSNFHRYIASYQSDNLKIYGLLTIPTATQPETGFPTILFLHGYIDPSVYKTTEGYEASQNAFARSNFITFKPDFRGHGKSEGEASGAHFSENYVVDTLHALKALQQHEQVDSQRIGVWGHSNGGEIGLRAMVISNQIKAGVFWAGVVGSFQDMLETYIQQIPFLKRQQQQVFEQYSSPSAHPKFWNQLDPYTYLQDISGPVQLHHGTGDEQVPVELSQHLEQELQKLEKSVELFEYQGADHNLSGSAFNTAVLRSVQFFKQELSR